MLNEAMTFTGLSWLLWRSVSGKHKEITQNSVMELFDGITDATEILGQIIGMPEDEAEGEDDLGNEPTNL